LKKKIAFIVQRYGLEINGGAEYHCRVVAEKLKDIYDVNILTSCAKDYTTWLNDYPEGITHVNDIPVHRFFISRPRDHKAFRSFDRKVIRKRKLYQKFLRFFGLLDAYEKNITEETWKGLERQWIDFQGPYLPNLVEHLQENHSGYDALIFFTYLYYPTVYGINVAPQKSILIPTAHDEPSIYMRIFKDMFNIPAAILYNTLSEKRFVNKLTGNSDIYSEIAGLGIETAKPVNKLSEELLNKTGDNYLIYIGRVDVAKGCKTLIDHFIKYKAEINTPFKLVMVGQVFLKIPPHNDVITLGFVSEDDKLSLLANAHALVIPSLYESLSLVTLESMAYGIPVIANQKCEVLKDHIENSHAGFLFADYESFKLAVDTVSAPNFDKAAMAANAKKYIAENYTWDMTIRKYQNAIDLVSHH
jgi:glycosyltransferase involved in cell wall biosynthesis